MSPVLTVNVVTNSMATEACRTQKVRRATQPSATVVHMGLATPSASAAARVNGAQEEACTCANTNTKSNTPENNTEDPEDEDSEMTGTTSHGSNTPSGNSAQSSRVHAPSIIATPAASSAHHGVMTTPSAASSSRVATPSGADAFSPFKGAGSQVIPSLTVVAGGVLAGVVGVFAAL